MKDIVTIKVFEAITGAKVLVVNNNVIAGPKQERVFPNPILEFRVSKIDMHEALGIHQDWDARGVM